jgi:hypothetical protein
MTLHPIPLNFLIYEEIFFSFFISVVTDIFVKVPEMKGLHQRGGEWLSGFGQSRVTGHAYNLKMKI